MHDQEQYILENIRNLRRAKGIKSSALANNLGISQGEYSKIENGHRSDYHSYLPQIAQSLGVDFYELISPPPEENTDPSHAQTDKTKNVKIQSQSRDKLYLSIISGLQNVIQEKDLRILDLTEQLEYFRAKYYRMKERLKQKP